jgi:hypothetical protein
MNADSDLKKDNDLIQISVSYGTKSGKTEFTVLLMDWPNSNQFSF